MHLSGCSGFRKEEQEEKYKDILHRMSISVVNECCLRCNSEKVHVSMGKRVFPKFNLNY